MSPRPHHRSRTEYRRRVDSCQCRTALENVERYVKTAQHLGHLRQVKYLLAILAVMDGQSFAQVALVLRVQEKIAATWARVLCCYGLQGAPPLSPPPAQTAPNASRVARSVSR